MEIVLDPARTAALRLSPSKVAEKVRDATVLQAVGRFDDAHALVTVMASGEPQDARDLGAIPIAVGADGSPFRCRRSLTIDEGAEDRLLRVSGPGGETVLLSVSRLPRRQHARRGGRGYAPPSRTRPAPSRAACTPSSVYDQADAGRRVAALDSRRHPDRHRPVRRGHRALPAGSARAGWSPRWRFRSRSASRSSRSTCSGQSLNLMSMGGLAVAIGLVVDDAIVVVEAIRRRLERGPSAGRRRARWRPAPSCRRWSAPRRRP